MNHLKYSAMLKYTRLLFYVIGCSVLLWSCEKDLELEPEDTRNTANDAFANVEGYTQALGKIYAGISLSGQRGKSGLPDLEGLNEGFSNYLRLYWKMQELTTDEAVIGWDDGTIKDLNAHTWTSGNEFIRTMYDRLLYQVALCNEFLRQSAVEKLDERGINGADRSLVNEYINEARFMRALSYWHLMDLYANPPFVTENDPIGAFLPQQTNRAALFNYIEDELEAIENSITPARQGEYGRADQGAVWMLLSKLYLNAQVYLGSGVNRFNDCIEYCNKIINAGYSIPNVPYNYAFIADNDSNGAQNEFIFSIPFDGLRTQSFGGTTFLVHAPVGGSMNPRADFGINGGWFGLRTTPTFIEKFGTPLGEEEVFQRDDNGDIQLDDSGSPTSLGFQQIWDDKRLLAYTAGQNLVINDISVFNDGYAIQKYTNIDSNGNVGSDPEDHPDTDFPMFRLADTYLMYAEATVRGASEGDLNVALGYINELRERAYGDTSGNITSTAEIDEDFILDERARELYWEAHRRTDLIRFDKFTQSVWAFKGNVPNGAPSQPFRNIMPIPATDLGVNTNLKQNPNY